MDLIEIEDYLNNTFKPTNLGDAEVVLEMLKHLGDFEYNSVVLQDTLDEVTEENKKLKASCKSLREQLIEVRESKDDLEIGLLSELVDKR